MSSEPATIDLQTGLPEREVSASSVWSKTLVERTKIPWVIRLGQAAGMLLAIAASPATAVSDFWFFDRRRHDTSTVTWIVEGMIGLPISRTEALRIASQILERAERERTELADWEANRGIQWEMGA